MLAQLEQAVSLVRGPFLAGFTLRDMRLRFSLGDRAGALRAYTTCCEVLTHELDLEPESETVTLAKRICRTTPVRLTKKGWLPGSERQRRKPPSPFPHNHLQAALL